MSTAIQPRHPDDGLADRLAELAAVTPQLASLQTCEIHGHVAGVRTYLHDEVLPQAHAEELALFPFLERVGSLAGAGLAVEHDTVRVITAELDELAGRPATTEALRTLHGVLLGVEALLAGHLAHESAALDALAELGDDERAELSARLLADPGARPAKPTWLPEHIPHEGTIGSADLLEPEAMVGASCPPTVLAVVRSAIAASSEGTDADGWRGAVLAHSRYRLQVPGAERCMRASGLWPWSSAT